MKLTELWNLCHVPESDRRFAVKFNPSNQKLLFFLSSYYYLFQCFNVFLPIICFAFYLINGGSSFLHRVYGF